MKRYLDWLMPDCRAVSGLVSRGLDDRLSRADRWRVGLHLALCAACRNFADQAVLVQRAARQLRRRLGDGGDSPENGSRRT